MARTQSEAQTDLGSLVYCIHAATEQEGGWGEVLDRLRSRLGARSAALGYHHFADGTGATLHAAPVDDALAADCAKFAGRNPWFLSSLEYTRGRVMTGDDLIGHRDLMRTDFYRGVLRPRGLLHRLCGVVARHGEIAYYVAAHRGSDQDPFVERDRASLKSVLSHMTLALQNSWRYRQADDLAKAMMQAMDQAGHATLLVAPDGQVVYRSKSVESVVQPRIGLQIRDNVVSAIANTDARALREALADMTRPNAPADDADSRVITIALAHSPHPAMVRVRPGGQMFLAMQGRSARLAVITVRGGHAPHDPQACAFARQFDLTPAQAKVNSLVFTGHPLPSVAQTLGVSDNTVRSHLKQIFQKTGTHGQMQLVHLHAQVCVDKS